MCFLPYARNVGEEGNKKKIVYKFLMNDGGYFFEG
jgi:hypothetical protein